MATLSHLPPLQSSIPSTKLLSTPLHIFYHKLHCYSHQNLPRICASFTKKSRASRKAKSNEDLYKDIREFLSTVGLPHDHVPSTKELSQHGRQDLANIVRRRGYKFIRELLATQIHQQGGEKVKGLADVISLSSEPTEVERQREGLVDYISFSSETMKDEENIYSSAQDISFSSETTEVEKQTEDLAEDVSPSDEATKDEEVRITLAEDVSLSREGTISSDNIRSPEMTIELKDDDLSYTGLYSSSNTTLEEKVAKFVLKGELDDTEDSGFEISKRSSSEDSSEFTKSQDAIESNSDYIHGAHEDLAFSGSDGSDLSNGHIALSCQSAEHPALETNTLRAENLSNEKAMVVDLNEELDLEAQKADSQAEISRLRYMLHQKEMQLIKLKEEIEKEKLALSILQTKAEKKISEAQKLISEKDTELRAAEESLSGLKEVEIQYWGEGEIIEVSGSFNGWQQRIKMDPLPSSSISDQTGSWKSRTWRTVLWLYPGVYEIKFIADGHWTIDPQRESVNRGSIHNNILRVDR